jgi:hypothetical protein
MDMYEKKEGKAREDRGERGKRREGRMEWGWRAGGGVADGRHQKLISRMRTRLVAATSPPFHTYLLTYIES